MAALTERKALRRLRHRDTEPHFWDTVNSFAAWRSQFEASRTVLEPYRNRRCYSSIERERLIALVSDVARAHFPLRSVA